MSTLPHAFFQTGRRRLSPRFLTALVVALTPWFAVSTRADVKLPNVFSDHMVLQQQQANKIWGLADPGEKISVTFAGETQEVTADAEGNWHVMLSPVDATAEPHEIKIKGNNEITLSDVLVGEVWICSGQSNMQWNVGRANDPDLEQLAAKFPQIRMINFPQVGRQEPVWTHPNAKWQLCTPETVGSFSAVGYFFGRQLHETLDVPVGLINNAWGGSAAEAWVPREILKSEGKYDGLLERWEQTESQFADLSARKDSLNDQEKRQLQNLNRNLSGNHRPGNIYNGVLKSHLGYGIRGAIWYQGESNAGRAYQYRDLFPLMIQTWRDQWGEGDFPFYWVQLADFMAETDQPQESDWAELREAQTMTMDRLPNTGQAVIIDIGEGRDIHPKNKVDVGRRLARLALANDYGVKIASQSPRFESVEFKDGKAILTMQHVDGGWRPFDVNKPVGFAIAGADKKFVWADAKIVDGGKIEVWSDQVTEPASVRYGWSNNPVCNMYDQAGLPLTPFRTDDWDGVTKGRQ